MNRIIRKILRAADILFSFCLAGTVVFLGYRQYWETHAAALLILSMVLGGIVSSVAASAFHELGHFTFGKLCGFRFNSMRIGFVCIRRQEEGIRLSFERMPENLAGSTEMLPESAENLCPRFLAVVSGGPVFSLLFLAGCTAALVLHARLPFAAYTFLCTALPYAFHLFFFNVLPFGGDGLDTDGDMLRGLIKKEPSYMTAVNILAIEGYLYQGRTPGEIDEALYFGAPQLPEDDFNFLVLTSYRMMYYIDREDVPSASAAASRLESLSEYIPSMYRGTLLSDVLYCKCAVEGDPDGARRIYPAVSQYLKGEKTLSSRRVAAAYELYVNGNRIAALQELSAAQQRAEICPVLGEQKFERKLLARIRRDIDISGQQKNL